MTDDLTMAEEWAMQEERDAASRLAAPSVIAEHPDLDGLDLPHVTPENWRDEVAVLESRFGPTLTIHPVGWNRLADSDPITTLVDMVGEDRVIAVRVDRSTPEEGGTG